MLVALTRQQAATATTGDMLVINSLQVSLVGIASRAAGLIAGHGGPLSNGATLAREYGIPVVVLEAAMLRLHTGDRVTVDGSLGTVELWR